MNVKREPGTPGPWREWNRSDTGLDRRAFLRAGTALAATVGMLPTLRSVGAAENPMKFRRVPTQYIAALGPDDATSGGNAHTWGLWPRDPGPRGVRLEQFAQLQAAGGLAPAQWQFDSQAWWLEEHGLIMESPEFPLPAGTYLVTGDREVTAALTVEAPGADGAQHWSLAKGATIYDVTHLRCRSAVYTPATAGGACTPALARPRDFPVTPGAAMPPVEGCSKQDYAVLIVIGMAVEA